MTLILNIPTECEIASAEPTNLKKHMRMPNHKCKYACAVSQSYIWKFCLQIIGWHLRSAV